MTREHWIAFVVFPLIGYVLGATPFAWLLARHKGIDLRAHGSGNLGATNLGRVVGRKWGYLCFFLDVAKGLVPVLAAGAYLRREGLPGPADQAAWLAVAFAAVMGHVLSFWVGFRGGKGVATSLGVVLGIWPYYTLPGLAAFALWIAVTLIWRYVSLGSVVAVIAFPVLFILACLLANWPVADLLPLLAFAIAMAAMVVFRHRTNLSRLLKGTENKIGRRGGKAVNRSIG
jgi:acyl phosphate:glycerol-3-phosphate acyltransferase